MADGILNRRSSGIVLHPTSLPGPHGSGDFGPSAYHFVEWLKAAGQSLWQTLPLGPIGPGNSPYMGSSAFAGNPLLVAFEPMVEKGWLQGSSLSNESDRHRIDFSHLVPWRMNKLREAFRGMNALAQSSDSEALKAWAKREADWVEDYALFMALDKAYSPKLWPEWPASIARRDKAALADARKTHAEEIRFWLFVQWQFDEQWASLKAYAHERGVAFVGDLPIFVAHHSADCWSRPDLYDLDAKGEPRVIAGVPPDFFSETGQRWGNPLYNWAAMKKDKYAWWTARIRRQLALADIIRIDHFRGFSAYWEIPASEPNAIKGSWKPGPGADLFDTISEALGSLPVIAEDLGVITEDVVALRLHAGLPGMRILQFAFDGDAGHPFLPHNFERETVVYSGTHDNDTVKGWWNSTTERERSFAAEYLGISHADAAPWAMISACAHSVANIALYPLQDVLGLDDHHRMNIPGTTGCWTWRFDWSWFPSEMTARLARLVAATGRGPFGHLTLPAYPEGKIKPGT
jgi:4-alpha-glucanotransferase